MARTLEGTEGGSINEAESNEQLATGFLIMTMILSVSMILSQVSDRLGIKSIGSAAIATSFGLLCGAILMASSSEENASLLHHTLEIRSSVHRAG